MPGDKAGRRVFFQPPWWWPKIISLKWLDSSYLVGGAVRDFLIKKRAVDLDLLVPQLDEEKAFELADEFGSPCFKLGKENYVYRIVAEEGKIDLAPLINRTLEEEVKRRDFTVNSLLLPLSALKKESFFTREIIDFLGGLQDLEKKVLRLCQPDSFQRDPVRLLRAVRFCLELDLEMVKETASQLERDKKLLRKASGERVKSELIKLFSLEFPVKALQKLVSLSLWTEILNYGGLIPKTLMIESQLKEAWLTLKRVEKTFPDYFQQELEKELRVKQLFSFFLALFLSATDKNEIPSALTKFRFSRKTVKACRAWLKFLDRDWFKDKSSQATLVIESGDYFPGCLALILISNQKNLSQKSLLELKKMHEIEKSSLYPFSSEQVIREKSLTPSRSLGEEIKKRKTLFLAGILDK